MRFISLLIACFTIAAAQEPCKVASPTATFSIPYVAQPQELSTDPSSPAWSRAASAFIEQDCTHKTAYPKLKSQVRGFWTDTDVYLLFACPYDKLNLWQPADNSKDRDKLWDRDVVEFFLGDDWKNIKHYREFEIAPTGDWIDLAIDLTKNSYGAKWNVLEAVWQLPQIFIVTSCGTIDECTVRFMTRERRAALDLQEKERKSKDKL